MTDDEPADDTDIYVQGVVLRDEATGLEEVHVYVGGPDVERVRDGILAGFQQTLRKHLPRKEFGGEIVIVILAEVTPQSPALWTIVAQVEEELKASLVAGKIRTASSHPLRVSFEYTGRDEEV